MANHNEQYGRQTDEYGNPIHRPGGGVDHFGATGDTESYANQPGATAGGYGTHGGGTTGTTGAYGTQEGMTGTTGAHGTHGGVTTGATGGYGTHGGGIGHETTDAGLTTTARGHRRSGSSSSSSSEDDGQGGRRKKGLKEKIKEKLPGGQKDEPTHGGATGTGYGAPIGGTTGAGYAAPAHGGTTAAGGGYDHPAPEKKGIMDKIKDKLPGGGHH